MIAPKAKKAFFGYQRAIWLANQAYNEVNKPLNFAHITVPWMTYLAVNGLKLGIWSFILINLAILLIAIIFGKYLEKLNVISYNQTLSNKQSPELLEILERVRNIEENIKGRK